jgi:ribosomal protein S18 acetylase RimI-like enzyme
VAQIESAVRYRIETMSLTDYDDVMRLWQNTEGVGLNESDNRCAIASYLKRNPGMSFVARLGTEIAGAVLCGHDGRRGYLHHLAVAKPHRRRGLGRRLVKACLAELKRLRILKCNIFLFADNAAGGRFWRHNGWVRRADLLVMQKNILPTRHRRCC